MICDRDSFGHLIICPSLLLNVLAERLSLTSVKDGMGALPGVGKQSAGACAVSRPDYMVVALGLMF
jgi:hypothetical protein